MTPRDVYSEPSFLGGTRGFRFIGLAASPRTQTPQTGFINAEERHMSSIRNHPVRQLLDHAAIGGQVSDKELDELRFGDDIDRGALKLKLRGAIRAISVKHAEGEHGEARRLVREHAAEIIDLAGEPIPEQDDEPRDPAALAERVRRW